MGVAIARGDDVDPQCVAGSIPSHRTPGYSPVYPRSRHRASGSTSASAAIGTPAFGYFRGDSSGRETPVVAGSCRKEIMVSQRLPGFSDLVLERGAPARMRDGTTLYADVYRPSSGGPFPILLM